MGQLILMGKNSNGKNQYLDLESIPLLICSYSNDEQLDRFFIQLSKLNTSNENNSYLITNTRLFNKWGFADSQFNTFFKDEPETGSIHSWSDLIAIILKQVVERQKIMKQKKLSDFKKYIRLNTWNEHKLNYQFLLIDDIWDIVKAKPKKLTLDLMLILLYGPAVGIHTIFASGISYRNLLQQLVGIHPILTLELQKKYGRPEPKQISALGHELIYTPDELVFYKKQGSFEMERFFK